MQDIFYDTREDETVEGWVTESVILGNLVGDLSDTLQKIKVDLNKAFLVKLSILSLFIKMYSKKQGVWLVNCNFDHVLGQYLKHDIPKYSVLWQ